MSTTIESLELEILSSSQSAESGLDKLTASLEKLKTATKGGLGLGVVAKQLQTVNSAANGISPNAVSNVTGLAKAIQLLSGTKISSTVATQITAVSTALNGADFTGGKEKINSLVDALSPLSNMSKSNLASYVSNIKKIPDAFKGLNDIDMSAFSAKVRELADALRPLADEMQKVANGFSAFPSKLQKLIGKTNNLAESNGKVRESYINLWAKLKMGATMIKGIASKISGAVKKMNDYVENINLFTASMGKYADEAKEYAEKVGELMGIDPGEWMRNQGVFMTLATGFGVAGDRAYEMSQQLTQLGYDLSSFFNISYEDAMEKLQSGLAGELEPLRRLGYDLSQAKLQAVALSLGIDKTISSMTQAEKAQLRYYAIMTQVTTAQGDMSRTLNAPANQIRILKAQVTQASRAIGSIFIPAINACLPYVIALAQIIRYLASSIASLFGFEMPEVDYSGIESVVGGAEDASDALDNATASAKKLKSYMLGFDELNVINPNEGGDGSGLEEVLPGGGFDFELPTYDFIGDATSSRVATIVEEMKEWLGITGEINSWSDLFDTRLGEILTTVGLIGGGIGAWKVADATIEVIKTIKTLLSSPVYAITIGAIVTVVGLVFNFMGLKDAIENGLSGINFAEIVGSGLLSAGSSALLGAKLTAWIATAFEGSAIAIAIGKGAANLGGLTAGAFGAAMGASVIGIIAGIPAYFVGIYDACKNGIDWLSTLLINAGVVAAGAGIGAIIGACGGPITAGIGALIGLVVGLATSFGIWLWQVYDKVKEWANQLPQPFQDLVNTLGGIVAAIGSIILLYVAPVIGLPAVIVLAIKSLGEAVGKIDEIVTAVSDFIEGIPDLPEKISEKFDEIEKWLDDLPTKVSDKLDEMKKSLDDLPNKIKNWFTNIKKKIKTWFSDLWKPIKDYDWSKLGRDIGEWFGNAVKNAYTFVTESVPTWWEDVKTSVKDGFEKLFTETLPKFFNETLPQIVQDVADFFEDFPEKLNAVITSVKDGIKDVGSEILNGIFEGLNTIGTAITDFVDGFVQGFKDALGIHSPSTVFAEIGGYLIEGLFGGMADWLDDISTWCDDNIITPFNDAMDGALSFAVDVKNNATQWWSNVKSWWNDESNTGLSADVKLEKSGWSSLSSWIGNAVSVGVSLLRNGWSTISTFVGNTVSVAVSVFKNGWTTISNFVGTAVSTGVSLWKSGWSNIGEWVGQYAWVGIGLWKNGWSSIQDWIGNITATLGIKLPKIGLNWGTKEIFGWSISYPTGFYTYAQGGFPDFGEMFIAREAGPELVGTIGNRNAVVNNDQIVESVSAGVYQAVIAALGSNSDEGGDTQIIINLDGEKIYENQQKVARNRGYNLGMGVFSFG